MANSFFRDTRKRNHDHRNLYGNITADFADFSSIYCDVRQWNRDHRKLDDNITSNFADFCKFCADTRIYFDFSFDCDFNRVDLFCFDFSLAPSGMGVEALFPPNLRSTDAQPGFLRRLRRGDRRFGGKRKPNIIVSSIVSFVTRK